MSRASAEATFDAVTVAVEAPATSRLEELAPIKDDRLDELRRALEKVTEIAENWGTSRLADLVGEAAEVEAPEEEETPLAEKASTAGAEARESYRTTQQLGVEEEPGPAFSRAA